MADEPSTSKGAAKNPSGKILRSGQRLMAYNIYLKCKENGLSKTQAVVKSAAEVGVGKCSMWKIVGYMESAGKVESPSKKRSRGDIFSKLTEDEKKAVRHAVHAFFKRNELPTLDKVLHVVEENDLIPSMSRSSLFKVLKNLRFVWEKRGRNSMLVERGDIIIWRSEELTHDSE